MIGTSPRDLRVPSRVVPLRCDGIGVMTTEEPRPGADDRGDDRAARAEALLHDMQVANARLRAELEVARADVESLHIALTDVTPLHRHVVRDVKRRLGRTDAVLRSALAPRATFAPVEVTVDADGASTGDLLASAATTDRIGVATWTSQPTSSAVLRVYERVSRAAYQILRRLLSAAKKAAKRRSP